MNDLYLNDDLLEEGDICLIDNCDGFYEYDGNGLVLVCNECGDEQELDSEF